LHFKIIVPVNLVPQKISVWFMIKRV